MIDTAMKTRKAKIEEHQDLLVEMRPEFVSALKSSLNFSSNDFIPFNIT